MKAYWYALPHCPPRQLTKIKYASDAAYDIASADTVIIPTLQQLEAEKRYTYEYIGPVKDFPEINPYSINTLKVVDGDIYRKKYDIPTLRTGVILKYDQWAWSLVAPRSGLCNFGLVMPNSVGIIDYEYSNINEDDIYASDELKIKLIALYQPVVVFRGERIAQLIPQNCVEHSLEQTYDRELFKGATRGGFHSSGSF